MLFWMCDLVVLTQHCKLISFLYLIYYISNSESWCIDTY